jgi:hypothetical protein
MSGAKWRIRPRKRKVIQRSEKKLGIEPILKATKLPDKVPSGFHRMKADKFLWCGYNRVCIQIKGLGYYFPRHLVSFGYHPSGFWHCIDLDMRIAKEKGFVIP